MSLIGAPSYQSSNKYLLSSAVHLDLCWLVISAISSSKDALSIKYPAPWSKNHQDNLLNQHSTPCQLSFSKASYTIFSANKIVHF